MKAEPLINRRITVATDGFVELVLWRVPTPVKGSAHRYKYRLAYVLDGVCVLRYDNEAGKGGHKHIGATETHIAFSGPDQLLSDFYRDVEQWNNENRNA